MRKVLTVMLSLVLMASIVAACGGNNNNGKNNTDGNNPPTNTNKGDNDSDKQPEQVAISVYYPTPDRTADRELEDDKIRRFNEVYPNVEIIKADWQYDPAEIGLKMGANEAPTLFNTYATEGKYLAERGWAADITTLWNNYEYKDQFSDVMASQFNIGGKIYGIPQKGYVTGVVVNKTMLEEKGITIPGYDWTWDDLYNVAAAATNNKEGISGIALMGKGGEAGWNWTNFLFEAGGDVQDVTDKVTATFNSEAGLKALEFYNKLRWEADAIPTDWALGWGDAVGSFAQGRTAMVIAGASDPVDQALNQGGMGLEDVMAFPMPAATKGGSHIGVLGGDYLVINPNATPAEQEAAFNYAVFDYFSDDAVASAEKSILDRQANGEFFIPPVIEYFKMDSEYGKKMQALYDKYDNVFQFDPEMLALLEGKPEAQFNTQDYYSTMANVIQEVFSNKNTDLKATLDAAAKLVQETYFDPIVLESGE